MELHHQGRTAAGDVQVMSAGTGVTHAEYNLEDQDTTLFQIWIETDRPGAQPSWGAKPFPKSDRSGAFVALALVRLPGLVRTGSFRTAARILTVVMVVTAAAVYPARRAARYDPVDVIRGAH